jgi:hypothetical protein
MKEEIGSLVVNNNKKIQPEERQRQRKEERVRPKIWQQIILPTRQFAIICLPPPCAAENSLCLSQCQPARVARFSVVQHTKTGKKYSK